MSLMSEDEKKQLATDFIEACKAMGGDASDAMHLSNDILCSVTSQHTNKSTDILFNPSERSIRMIRKDNTKEVIEHISLNGIESISPTHPYLGMRAESENQSVVAIYKNSLNFFAEGKRY